MGCALWDQDPPEAPARVGPLLLSAGWLARNCSRQIHRASQHLVCVNGRSSPVSLEGSASKPPTTPVNTQNFNLP